MTDPEIKAEEAASNMNVNFVSPHPSLGKAVGVYDALAAPFAGRRSN